jgi:type VI secretion system protein ImpI/type VI secretion system protein
MATLTLTVLRCPDYGSAEQRQVHGGELTIGRGAECHWTLADPCKSLSRKHCTLQYIAGAWQVRDMSGNGTFLNSATVPIGRDGVHVLRSGDRLGLGDYEIEARIEEDPVYAPAAAPPFEHAAGALPFGQGGRASFGSARLPGLDDTVPPFGPGASSPFERTVPDHAPMSANAYGHPTPVRDAPPPAAPSPAEGFARVPDGWMDDLHGDDAPPVPPPPAPPPAPPQPAPVAAAARPAPGGGEDMTAALVALLQGGELTPDFAARAAADPQGALRNAGALLRAAVGGLRALLIGRGVIKREFRIEQTVLRERDNNPLKFASSDEHALAVLLDPRSNGLAAVRDSINDLSSHQVALLAATQAAARALLEQLEPSKLEAEDVGSALLPGAAERRLWAAYKRRHARVLEQFEDDFESAFSKAFARAYEQAVGRERD